MAARDFSYHLLSIGVNREANGASIRSAERDAFGISWTFAQLGYWRVERNRCLTGSQASPAAIDAHLASCSELADLDLLLIFWSGHLFSIESILETFSRTRDARLRILIVDTCQADDRLKQLDETLTAMPDEQRPIALASCAADGRSRENSVHGFFTARAAPATAPAPPTRCPLAQPARRLRSRVGRSRGPSRTGAALHDQRRRPTPDSDSHTERAAVRLRVPRLRSSVLGPRSSGVAS